MKFFSEGNFAEMELAVLSQLPPEDLLAMAATGSHAKVLARDRLLWKNKLKIHFPEVFATHARSRTRNWYRLFKTCYKTAYAGLTERQRRICSLLKEADVSGLKELSPELMLSDLEVILPSGEITYRLIEKSHSRVLQNYCYKFAESQLYETPQEDRLPSQLHQYIHNNLLLWAIICRRSAAELQQLVILGANVEARASVINACDDGRLTLMHLAARWGNLEAVESLIIHGADVDQRAFTGDTPLCIAAFNAQLEIAKFLGKEGANINSAADDGVTPLYIAAQLGCVEMVSYLLEQGALVDRARNEGSTPLHVAAQQGHLKVVKLLVKAGANINALTNKGATPLYLASCIGQVEVVRYLRDRGALIMTAALSRNTPVSIAKKNHHYKVLNELKLPELKKYISKTEPHANQPRSLTLFPGVTVSLEQEKRVTLMGYTLLYVGAGKIALFGVTLLAVASQQEKLEAARCLKRVVQGKTSSVELQAHQKAFASGELRSLYSQMKLGLGTHS